MLTGIIASSIIGGVLSAAAGMRWPWQPIVIGVAIGQLCMIAYLIASRVWQS